MLQTSINVFLGAFRFPGLAWTLILLSVVLALACGAIWLTGYWPPVLKKPWLWALAAVSAFLTWTAIAFVQVPLQNWTGQLLVHFWSPLVLQRWLLLAGIPQIWLSGLVQEGAKLVPMVGYWGWNKFSLTPKQGLIVGAMAGAGFGVFEAVWVFNTIFASGFNWHSVEVGGYMALLGFWERLFSVGFHIAISALAGYGLARRLGWQFYLIASVLHGAANYSVVLLQSGRLTAVQTEIYIAVFAAVVTAVALWLRWRHEETVPSDVQEKG